MASYIQSKTYSIIVMVWWVERVSVYRIYGRRKGCQSSSSGSWSQSSKIIKKFCTEECSQTWIIYSTAPPFSVKTFHEEIRSIIEFKYAILSVIVVIEMSVLIEFLAVSMDLESAVMLMLWLKVLN